LVLGTFGRAFWILDDIRPFRELAKTKGAVLDKKFKVFDAPDAYLATFRSYEGERFSADAIYEGSNKSPYSTISIWNKTKAPEAKKDDKKPEEARPVAGAGAGGGRRGGGGASGGDDSKKATIRVITEGGDTIRTFKSDLDTGMNRITWFLNRKGIRFPSWDDPREDADEPSGGSVLPGRYKLVISFNGEKDSTFVNVKLDPRSEMTMPDIAAKDAVMQDFQKIVDKAGKAMARLREADKTISLVDAQMINAVDSVKTDLSKSGKMLKDSILNMKKMFMSAPDAKGIVRSGEAITNDIYKAMSMLNSSRTKPQANAMVAYNAAKRKVENVVDKVNTFFEKDWTKYQQKVETVKYSLFKKYEPIKMD
jgi:hypothetical protein